MCTRARGGGGVIRVSVVYFAQQLYNELSSKNWLFPPRLYSRIRNLHAAPWCSSATHGLRPSQKQTGCVTISNAPRRHCCKDNPSQNDDLVACRPQDAFASRRQNDAHAREISRLHDVINSGIPGRSGMTPLSDGVGEWRPHREWQTSSRAN